jgi:hypothetical protein
MTGAAGGPVIEPQDDFPHPVPPQAFMTWKENWVFPAVDRDQGIAALFHVSLRPQHGEGIFTAKFHLQGEQVRHVSRSPVPAQLDGWYPIADDHVRFEIVEPGEVFRLTYEGEELEADLLYRARFPAFDFADGPKPDGTSTVGPIGLSVFPFNHYEQALEATGTIVGRAGRFEGRRFEFSGYGNRDHSWGWRDDFQFRHHHWICASFDDRYVQGSVMLETSFPEEKHGGFVSREQGNVAVAHVDTSGAYWMEPGEPIGELREDVTYRIHTVEDERFTVTAKLQEDHGRLYLNARSPDRSQLYMDVQMFCDFHLAETGQLGAGVLEVGKYLEGEGVADRYGKRPR